MAAKKLSDYIEKKVARDWDLVQCKVEKELSKKFKEQLKRDGCSITAFVTGSMKKYLDESTDQVSKPARKK